ncbi:ferredoxin:protochlorophyllide reductase (ATP-dependent) subunit B, partial [Pseudanabaenaceae cyanobacterium LEGE 13415]|nr:ferredoxin:protochlorophyllide reductase (ATP-dependent) subunit B [Pseudanabaenaceae cyanobacterium LEGE 13415]
MKLAYWMYAGPAHIGTLRIASSFKNVHAIMHAPLGDDYFNVMRSMLERERDYTPVTTSVVDRNVLARGSQEKVVDNITRKDSEEHPDLIVLTPTCTSSILQEDLQNFVERAQLEAKGDVMLADVNHYRVNELQAADRTLQQIVQFYITKARKKGDLVTEKTEKPSVNIFGLTTLGFHNNHDATELKKLMSDLGIEVNAIVPQGASVHELKTLPRAWFNLVPYRETGLLAAQYLEQEFGTPYVDITPMGIVETARCIRKIQQVINAQGATVDYESFIDQQTRYVSQAAWFSRSIDCQNLTGKKAVVFGDSTHA